MKKWIVLLMTTIALASTSYEINCLTKNDTDIYNKAESLSQKSRELLDFCRTHKIGENLTHAQQLLHNGADANAFFLGRRTRFVTVPVKNLIIQGKRIVGGAYQEEIITGYYVNETCLSHAVRSGDAGLVQLLIDHGASVDGEYGWSSDWRPLHLAASLGYTDVSAVLIRAGADVNYQRRSGYDGEIYESPLHLAAGRGHVEVCKLLIDEGARVNAQRIYDIGWSSYDIATPLRLARQYGHKEVVQLLRAAGASE